MSNLYAVPQELRDLPCWLLWKYVDVGTTKLSKIPFQINGTNADVTKAEHWSTFDAAFNALQFGGYDGLGFVFDNSHPYSFIDLDDTGGDSGAMERQIKVYKEFDSYSEKSPSGKGLHIIVKGKVPTGRRRSSIEIYSHNRYATMTGNVYNHKPIIDRHDLLNALYQQMDDGSTSTKFVTIVNEDQSQDDVAIIKAATDAANGDKFLELYQGDWKVVFPKIAASGQGPSEADQALINIITFYTKNVEQISRIFKASILGKRDKIVKNKSYLPNMIKKAFDQTPPKIDFDVYLKEIDSQLKSIAYSNPVNSTNNLKVFDGKQRSQQEISSEQKTLREQQEILSRSQYTEKERSGGLVSGIQEKPEMQQMPRESSDLSGFSSHKSERERRPAGSTVSLGMVERENIERNQQMHSPVRELPQKTSLHDERMGVGLITPPDGLVGEIARFIYDAAPRPVPEIAIAAALGLMAGICGRAYNVSGTGLNQYILLLAMTGAGKEAMSSGIDKIINAVTMQVPVAPEFLGPSRIASGQALYKYLANKSQSFVSIIGEFGKRLEAMSNPKANSAEKQLIAELLDLYNKSGYGQTSKPSIYSDQDKNTNLIAAPAFSILGESTPDTFYNSLNEDMISDGLLPRFTLIEYVGPRPPLNEGHINVQPGIMLVEQIGSLMANAKTVMGNRRVTNVERSADANKMLHEFDKLADSKINTTDKEAIRQLWNRAHIKVLKISALIAVGQNFLSPMINVSDVLWAKQLVENDIKTLSLKFEEGSVGRSSDEIKQMNEIKRMIKSFINDDWSKIEKYCIDQRLHSAKLIPYSYLNKRLAAIAVFQKDRLGSTGALKRSIQSLIDSGIISEATNKHMIDAYSTTQKAYFVLSVASLNK